MNLQAQSVRAAPDGVEHDAQKPYETSGVGIMCYDKGVRTQLPETLGISKQSSSDIYSVRACSSKSYCNGNPLHTELRTVMTAKVLDTDASVCPVPTMSSKTCLLSTCFACLVLFYGFLLRCILYCMSFLCLPTVVFAFTGFQPLSTRPFLFLAIVSDFPLRFYCMFFLVICALQCAMACVSHTESA